MTRLFLILALVVLVLPVGAQSADELFQQAQRLERVNGDYNGAIELYRRVASDRTAPRALVADALINMGQAYESLGRNEALSAYRRVLSEFADLSDQARFARERVAVIEVPVASGPKPGDVTVIPWVELESNRPDYYGVDLSPDGKTLALVGDRGSFYLRDLETETMTGIETASSECGVSTLRFSPNGKYVGYGCWGDSGAGVLEIATGRVWRIFDGWEYFGKDPIDDHVETEVFDWTLSGDSLVIASETFVVGEESPEEKNHILVQSIHGGAPRIIENDYYDLGNYFWENNGCLMQNDNFFFGDWTRQYQDKDPDNFIQWSSTSSTERGVSMFDEGVDYYLAGCDKANNLIYYNASYPTGDRELWGATVDADGTLLGNTKLMNLDREIWNWFHPFTQDGNLYFSKTGGSKNGIWSGVFEGNVARVLDESDKGNVVGWTAVNHHLVIQRGVKSLRIHDEAMGTRREITLDVYRARSGALASNADIAMASYWPWNETMKQFSRTWLIDLADGSVIDSLDGVAAHAVAPDADAVFTSSIVDGRVCISRFKFDDRTKAIIYCGEKAISLPNNPIELSPSGNLMWTAYMRSDSSWAMTVLRKSDDGRYSELDNIPEGVFRPRFFPDDKTVIMGREDRPQIWNTESGEVSDLETSLPDGYRLNTGITMKIHPDGRRFIAQITSPEQDDNDLYVIHDVRSLMMEGKEPE